MVTAIEHQRFTVEHYHHLAETGVLKAGDRLELIEGEIIEMSPIGLKHAACVNRLNRLLVLTVGDQAIISIQNPVILLPNSEPQPDVMLLRPRPDFYEAHHPTPQDVLLLVEVSDTTLDYDRRVKLPLYAKHGVPVVWIVDVGGRAIATHSNPACHLAQTVTPATYQQEQVFYPNDWIALSTVPGAQFAVNEILGTASQKSSPM